MELLGNAGLLAKNLAPLLLGLTILVFLFDLLRARVYAALEFARLSLQLKPLAITALSGAVLLFVCSTVGLKLDATAPYYLTGLLVTYLLAMLAMKPAMRMMLQLAAAVTLTMLYPADGLEVAGSAYLFGALSLRLVLNFLKPKESRLDDIAPAFVYLAGMMFARISSGQTATTQMAMINSAFIIATLMTLMQRPFMRDDKILVKRLVLTLSGGLAFLVMVTKAVGAPEYVRMAALVGAGYGMAYALDALAIKKDCVTGAVKQILIIGIFSVLAAKLYGNLGLTCLAAGCMVGNFTQVPAAAALYFGARVLEQVFAAAHVSNVTGINLNHPSISASLYLGFFTALGLMALLKDVSDRRVAASCVALAAAFGTGAVAYLLHSEAAGSYLISLIISGVMVSIVGQSFFPEEEEKAINIAIVPALATTCALLSADLLAAGVDATINERLIVLATIGGVVALGLVFGALRGRGKSIASGAEAAR